MAGISPTGVEDLDLVLVLTFGWEWSSQPRFDSLFYTGTPEHKIRMRFAGCVRKKREKQIKKGKEKIREKEGKREKGERRKGRKQSTHG